MTDLIALSDESRVWIYQADEAFSEKDVHQVREDIRRFVSEWVSHSFQLKGYGNVFHKRFICLFVDESQRSASGCSIDSSRRFIQDLGKKYGVNLLARTQFAYLVDDEVNIIDMHSLKSEVEKGGMTMDTLFFDNLVPTKKDFLESWVKPLKDSWQARFAS